jgi:phosphatidylinositol glycan class S
MKIQVDTRKSYLIKGGSSLNMSLAKVTRLVVFAFWSFVLLGLPFWWKTTEVYRANLPFAEIDAWQSKQVQTRKTHSLIYLTQSFN